MSSVYWDSSEVHAWLNNQTCRLGDEADKGTKHYTYRPYEVLKDGSYLISILPEK